MTKVRNAETEVDKWITNIHEMDVYLPRENFTQDINNKLQWIVQEENRP